MSKIIIAEIYSRKTSFLGCFEKFRGRLFLLLTKSSHPLKFEVFFLVQLNDLDTKRESIIKGFKNNHLFILGSGLLRSTV
ncbi:hypothetical protein AVEN_151574-1 [Araneus ventricosus]|uniref:Uncharacterized protein n=1 Tax=Araneus ventricosus TaxID=182803 RepID=A0A4Y2HXG2_ARAVE|nr:hypothetical protein AVEN_151574-1 [Araneus ventricosus]